MNKIISYETDLLNMDSFMQFRLIIDYGVILRFIDQWYLLWTFVCQMDTVLIMDQWYSILTILLDMNIYSLWTNFTHNRLLYLLWTSVLNMNTLLIME